MAESAAMLHTLTHTHTYSEMSEILPSASLTVSMASMASMVAEEWAERREERKEDRKREKMTESERENEVQRKKKEEEEKKKGVKTETCFCAVERKNFGVTMDQRGAFETSPKCLQTNTGQTISASTIVAPPSLPSPTSCLPEHYE